MSVLERKNSVMIEDYLKRKNGGAVYNSTYNRGISSHARRESSFQQDISILGASKAAEVRTPTPPTRTVTTSSKPFVTPSGAVDLQGGAGGSGTSGLEGNGETYEPTVDVTHEQIFQAGIAQIDAEFWRVVNNPGSVLGAEFSPYYNVYMDQYRQRAEEQAANAYARSVAGAGGYGTSYATLAAEQAYRETMQGFDELTPSLVQSKSQRVAELLEEREQLKAYRDTAEAEEETEDGLTEKASEAAQYLQSTYGTAYSENAMRNDLAGKGYREADIMAALESQRKFAGAVTTDYKASSVADAISQAEVLRQAKANKKLTVEEYDEAKADNSAVIMENINAGMENINDIDYAALGISAEEWSNMEDGEKKRKVFDCVGQLVKSKVVTESDYYKLLYNDLKEEFNSKEYKESKTQMRDAVDSALIIQDLYDNGYLNDDMYTDLMYNQIVPQFSGTPAFETINNYDQEWRSVKGEPLSANGFFAKLESGNYVAPGITTTHAGSVQYFSPEEKELLLNLVRGKRKFKKKDELNKAAKGAT